MPKWVRFSALLLIVGAACSGSSGSKAAAAKPAAITSATVGAHPVSAISAVLKVATDAPTTVSAKVTGPGGGFDIPADAASATHEIPVVGMRAESDYTIDVTATPNGGGKAATRTLTWTTGALPDDLPAVSVETLDKAKVQPGYTVFNAWTWDAVPAGEAPPDAGFVLAVDGEGQVVWYQRLGFQVLDVDTTRRGTFLVTDGDALLQEFDLLGTITREWGSHLATGVPGKDLQGRKLGSDKTVPIDVDSSHHEVSELANGDVITLSTELIEINAADAKRLCPDNPDTQVVGDVVVELSPDGKVVQRWPISAVYDPVKTPGPEMCIQGPPIAPPNWFYPDHGLTRDWTHANAVEVHEDQNLLLVSSRHLDEIMALRYHDDADGKAGELLWSLGTHGTLQLTGEPPYHQHAVEMEDDGSLMMYDNGNMRPGTTVGGGTAPPFSRAVHYDVDLKAGTATQVWEHRDTWKDGRPIFTPFLGDVDLEPNGNILITHGGGSTAGGVFQAKIVEVVPGDAPDGSADTEVLALLVGDGVPPATPGPSGWSVYRSIRLPSLYFARE